MRLNEYTSLVGPRVTLIPYLKEHVEEYHGWMSDPFMQALTASEPLSLDEEYEMQKSWNLDEDKLTFIVTVDQGKLIGDVNLFLSQDEDGSSKAECEVMIAVMGHQSKGLGKEALQMMILYASKHLKISPSAFFAKIGMNNTPSLHLFQKLDFKEIGRSEVFQEVELRHALGSFDWQISFEEKSYKAEQSSTCT